MKNKRSTYYAIIRKVMFFSIFLINSQLFSQTFYNDTTWVVPECVSTVTVSVWGGSGAGFGASGNAGGGGGGGGGYSSAVISVTPGTTYNISVGQPGFGTSGAGGNGGDTFFDSNTILLAKGGKGATNGTGGAGAAVGVGTIKFAGGNGGNYSGNGGGGGGATASAAGNGANGSNGSGDLGGAGGAVSGDNAGGGGAGGNNNGLGTDNSYCFACGGGGGVGTAGGNGGHGSVGKVSITLPSPLVGSTSSPQTICPGNPPATLSGSATGGSGGAYSYTWQSSTTDSISGFTDVSGETAATFSPASISTTTWYRSIVNAAGCAILDTSEAVKVVVTDLTGFIDFPQTICSGSTATPLVVDATPASVSPTYQWQSSTTSATAGFSAIGGETGVSLSPGAISVDTWYDVIISAVGCVTYTASAVGIIPSSAPATCNAGGPSTIYSTNVLPLLKSSVGGSVTTGAWSIKSSSPAGSHSLSSTAQTNDLTAVTFTPEANYTGTVVLSLTTNSNGCNVSVCDRTIDVIAATYTTDVFTTSGSSTWTVPSCVSTVTVQTWGAGGGGGSGGSTFQDDGSGGGGGAFSSTELTVTSGTVFNLYVGAGGAGAAHTSTGKKGVNGENTWFGSPSTVYAQGGIGGLGVGQPGYGSPSLGGSALAGIGNIAKYSGGKGASGCLWPGGGGGGSAVPTSNGNDAPPASTNNCGGSSTTSTPGATALPGGGYGGEGGESNGGPGISGTCSELLATVGGFPGGGGGGGTNSCDQPGQAGADGQVKIIYGPALPVFITANSKTICEGQSANIVADTDYPVSFQWSTGATSPANVISDSISVSPTTTTEYTISDLSGCANPVTVTVTVNPAFTAGVNSETICGGETATLTATGASNYVWSTGATGSSITVSPATTTTYTVSADNGGCAIDLIATVTVNGGSSVAVNSATICAGTSTTLTASGGASYTWSPATGLSGTTGASVTASPTADITYTVSTGGSCPATTTSSVTVTALPTSNAGSDISICSGTSGNIGAGSTPGYTYAWSPATDLDGVTASSQLVMATNNTSSPIITSYTLTTTSGICSSEATVQVTVDPQDDATFSYSSNAFCAPSNDTPVKTSPGTGTFSINPTTNLSISPGTGFIDITTATNSGTYVVTLTTTDACPSTYTTSVDVVSNPDATFSYASPSYCANETPNPTVIQSAGSTPGIFSASPAGLAFIDSGTGEVDLAGSTANSYTVTNTIAAGGGCLATSATTVIAINAIPLVAVSDATICAGQPGTITASGATNYTWAGGGIPAGADLTDSPGTTTTYTVTGETNNCFATATGTITSNPNPIVNVTNSTNCENVSQTITASGATSYTWAGGGIPSGAGNQDLSDTPSNSTTYTVTGTSSGCVGTATGTITINPNPIISVADATVCSGLPATLTVNSDISGTTFLWSTTEQTGSINVSPSTTTPYSVTGTAAGCTGNATATVNVNATPTITVSPPNPVSVCLGETATLTASGATTYTFTPGNTTVNPLVETTTTVGTTVYTVIGETGGCVSAPATGTITVNAIPTVIVNNPTICAGETATLNASGASTYSWLPNTSTSASLNVAPTSATASSFTVTGTTDNCSNTDVAQVTINPLPIVTVSGDSICAGETTSLTANGAFTYTWLPGGGTGNTISLSPSSTTTYTVTGTSTDNCKGSGMGILVVTKTPQANFSYPEKIKLSEANISFRDNSKNASSWSWNFGDADTSSFQNPDHQYADTGLYTVCLEVITNGCFDSVCNTILIIPDVLVFIPNSFSPNDDGLNDGFGIKSTGIKGAFEFRIFDRWGNQLFFTTSHQTEWMGDYLGIPCQEDTYVYSILVNDSDGKEKTYLGRVTLIR